MAIIRQTNHPIVGTVRWQTSTLESGNPIEFLDGFETDNIVKVHVPQLDGVLDVRTDALANAGALFDGNLRFFKGAIPQLLAAFEEIEALGLSGRLLSFAGSFNARLIRRVGGGAVSTPSNHAFATGFDINSEENPQGKHPPAVGKKGSVRELVPVFRKYGFDWGGSFNTADGMHFEVERLLSAQEIERIRGADLPSPVPVKVLVNGNALPVPAVFLGGKTWIGVRAALALLDDLDTPDEDGRRGSDHILEAGGSPFKLRVLVGGSEHTLEGMNLDGTGFVRFSDLQPLYSVPFEFRKEGEVPVLDLRVGATASAAPVAPVAPVAPMAPTPPRKVLAQGSRGLLVRQVQEKLEERGHELEGIDSDYGGKTAAAVRRFQQAQGLPITGTVDSATWSALVGTDLPPLFDRILQVIARFEGHNFTLAEGNFDGAGVTWGIIGFTLAHDLGPLLKQIHAARPALLAQSFGADDAKTLLAVLGKSVEQRIAFANSIAANPNNPKNGKLAEKWRRGFEKLGEDAEVQRLQIEAARVKYFNPALNTAKKFKLETELGVALAFDIHVQNGGVETDEAKLINDRIKAAPPATERARRVVIAHVIADTSRAQFREDVRSRKLTMATGSGKVHGANFVLENWGLLDVAV